LALEWLIRGWLKGGKCFAVSKVCKGMREVVTREWGWAMEGQVRSDVGEEGGVKIRRNPSVRDRRGWSAEHAGYSVQELGIRIWGGVVCMMSLP
jgi:hypothetical protein